MSAEAVGAPFSAIGKSVIAVLVGIGLIAGGAIAAWEVECRS